MNQGEAAPVDSPCIGVCKVEPSTGLCLGCLRTLSEVASWSEASGKTKREILDRVAERIRLGHPVINRPARTRL